EWLIAEQKFPMTQVDNYFAAVNPESELKDFTFDSALREFLLSLNMPMTILTNAPREHALRVLSFLKIDDIFLSIHDIRSNNLKGKPHPQSYLNAIKPSGFSVDETLFFDDHLKYIKGYANIGGKGVLVNSMQNNAAEAYMQINSIYEISKVLG
ncbi:MAG: HAD-IA family hydrolase, partial [Treponemataceae bacterium]